LSLESKVSQFDLNNNKIKEFNSQSEAGQELNIQENLLVIAVKQKKTAGFYLQVFRKYNRRELGISRPPNLFRVFIFTTIIISCHKT
jgi:hypothetical protein